jgi:hypothetical protein
MRSTIFYSLFITILLAACKKENFITSPDARVDLSADTLKFDTVFTTTGSTSRFFKIRNDNNQKLRISSVKLMGGISSVYKINVDGFVGPEVKDLELEANDSLYVYVTVAVNQNSSNLPFIIRDSVQINFNGKTRFVQLEAWGKNARFFRNKKITGNEVWTDGLPFVILERLTIESSGSLTIQKGCQVFVHADAPIVVHGTLKINGEKFDSTRVVFQGDRLDEPYKNFPASWPGIYFSSSSKDNVLNYAVLKNAYQAIAVEEPSVNANPKITLNECIIDNAYDAGIISINSSVKAQNCLISNCGKNIVLAKGGNHQFTHCTVVSYSNSFIFHRSPVLFVSNFINQNNIAITANLNAVFKNCIFWGENGIVDDEVVVSKSGNTTFNVNFENNLWKVKTAPANITSTQIISNQNPVFDSINVSKKYFDFRLKAGSPALNKGIPAGITIDLDGKPRPVGLPDLGCYEKQ